jgi:hypothetical protein
MHTSYNTLSDYESVGCVVICIVFFLYFSFALIGVRKFFGTNNTLMNTGFLLEQFLVALSKEFHKWILPVISFMNMTITFQNVLICQLFLS